MENLYLKKAEQNLPEIKEKVIKPYAMTNAMSKGDGILIDLGNHYVGYFSFDLDYVDVYIDAPVRLYVKFGENAREIGDDFSAYEEGLCMSWLQEEIINIDFPGEYKMPRRYAARYIYIKVVASPKKLVLSDFSFKAVSSADEDRLRACDISDEELKKIDSVAVNTLKNCMHRIFEDGPKRDRRLWTGDLRLEALTNYYTFNNLSLVRRCLYLFAASDTNDKGFIPGFVYENPKFVSGNWFLVDYALLFVASACDYYNHTGDKETFNELYPAIESQMEAAHRALGTDGIMSVPKGGDVFIDWCRGLEKTTSLHGVYLYTLKLFVNVLENIGHGDRDVYAERYNAALECAVSILYNEEKKAFVNSSDNYQYSVHSLVWMILGGAVREDEARAMLADVLNSPDSVKPFTPYMHHYVVEAMVSLSMNENAKAYIKNYWGDMISLGADTFYEVYVPGDPDFSPYKDRMINSMCHAWSCTPAYFIRKYFN